MSRIAALVLSCLCLAGCKQDKVTTPEPTDSGLKPVSGDYVSIDINETQRELTDDLLQKFFFNEGAKGVWYPDADLSQSEGVQAIYLSLSEQCSDQIKLERINGHYKINKAYNQNLQASDFFVDFQNCLAQNIAEQPVPQEWLDDFSNFHSFQTQRYTPEVMAITKEVKPKKYKTSKKNLSQLNFKAFSSLLEVLAK